MVSYYRPIVTLCLKCTVLEIWRHIGRKSPKNPTHPHLARSFGVTSCEFFDELYLARNSWAPTRGAQLTAGPPRVRWADRFIVRTDIRTRDTTYQPDSQPKWQYPAVSWELEWWSYQMVYISRSCFRSAMHNTGVWQTDVRTDRRTSGHVAVAKTRASIASSG